MPRDNNLLRQIGFARGQFNPSFQEDDEAESNNLNALLQQEIQRAMKSYTQPKPQGYGMPSVGPEQYPAYEPAYIPKPTPVEQPSGLRQTLAALLPHLADAAEAYGTGGYRGRFAQEQTRSREREEDIGRQEESMDKVMAIQEAMRRARYEKEKFQFDQTAEERAFAQQEMRDTPRRRAKTESRQDLETLIALSGVLDKKELLKQGLAQEGQTAGKEEARVLREFIADHKTEPPAKTLEDAALQYGEDSQEYEIIKEAVRKQQIELKIQKRRDAPGPTWLEYLIAPDFGPVPPLKERFDASDLQT